MILCISIFTILTIVGTPTGISMGLAALIGGLVYSVPMPEMAGQFLSDSSSYLLLAVPFFVLSGNLSHAGKITERIFEFSRSLTGWLPGGLAHANILSSLFYAGMAGSAAADAAGLGSVKVKAMEEEGYTPAFSGAVTAASSVIGPVFPPSIPLVIYGTLAGVSVRRLFIGGVLPGVLMCLGLMIPILFLSGSFHLSGTAFDPQEMLQCLIRSLWALLTPVLILVGFITGWFTPAGGACVAAAYALVTSILIYRSLDWKSFKSCMLEAGAASANTLFIIGTASLFTWVAGHAGAPFSVAPLLSWLAARPAILLLVIHAILLIAGMFLEPVAIMALALPVFLPLIRDAGIDSVHFGVILVLNLMIGQITPPFGISLFILSHKTGVSVRELWKAIFPFLIPLLVVLLVCTFAPDVVLALPELLIQGQ